MPIISGGGGSAAPAFVGAVLALSVTETYSSGAVVAFDTALYDSDGFFNAAGTKLVVPAGLAGWFRVGAVLSVGLDPVAQPDRLVRVDTSGNPDNLVGAFEPYAASAGAGVAAGIMGPLAVGDDLRARLFFGGGGTVSMFATSSQLTCEYLGPN